jgi:hypothetical protein
LKVEFTSLDWIFDGKTRGKVGLCVVIPWTGEVPPLVHLEIQFLELQRQSRGYFPSINT